MNKTQLAEEVAVRINLPYNTVLRVLDAMQDVVTNELRSGHSVLVTGFVKFEPKELGARERRNPATGEKMVLLPKRSVRVRPMTNLKRDVDG